MESTEKLKTPKSTVRKPSAAKKNPISSPSSKDEENVKNLISAIEATGLDEFMEYTRSPSRMLWPNFVAGVMRGFGAVIGATVVIGLIGWTLSMLIDLPLIGKSLEPYIEKVQVEIKKYTEATNYNPHFENMERTLKSIEKNTTPKN